MRSAAPRGTTVEDLGNIAMVGAPRLSPDGQSVAFAVTRMDLDADRYRSRIWLASVDGSGEPRPLTASDDRADNPIWSPDGRWIAFTETRDEAAGQIWAIPVRGGEAVQVTRLTRPVESVRWSPDGSKLAFVSKVGPDAPGENEARVVRSIRYRYDGEGYLNEQYRQIWVVTFDSETGRAGEPRQLTTGPHEHRQPSWHPSGAEIAFRAARHDQWELGITSDIWTVRLDGHEPRKVTTSVGSWGNPVWSTDGRTMLILGASSVERAGYANTVLWRVSAAGGVPEPFTDSLDRSVGDDVLGDIPRMGGERVVWPCAGGPAHVLVSDRGNSSIYRVDTASGDTSLAVGGDRRIGSFDVLPDGGYVFAASTPTDPGDLFVCDANGGNERRLTDVNAEWRSSVRLATPESLWATAPDGRQIQGWLLRPSHVPETTLVPLVVELHGGPLAMYGNGFMHEFQLLASQGYAVLYANPRGSSGYGEAFACELIGRWGEADQPDVMAVIDAVIDRGGVDRSRIGVLGGSYGGILTNWLVGHSDRFKAAVTMRSCSNFISAAGADDISFNTNVHTFGVDHLTDPETFWRLSPITYVEGMRTPMMIIQNELDFRCPMEQAEQLYVALKRLRRTVEFVRFPDESHGLSRSGKPKHRAERLRQILRWFDMHL